MASIRISRTSLGGLQLRAFWPSLPTHAVVSGGTPPDEDKARELHAKTDPKDITAAAIAAVPFVLTHPESNGIPRSRHDPKILWVDDAEIVGDRIQRSAQFRGHRFTQETKRRIGELARMWRSICCA